MLQEPRFFLFVLLLCLYSLSVTWLHLPLNKSPLCFQQFLHILVWPPLTLSPLCITSRILSLRHWCMKIMLFGKNWWFLYSKARKYRVILMVLILVYLLQVQILKLGCKLIFRSCFKGHLHVFFFHLVVHPFITYWSVLCLFILFFSIHSNKVSRFPQHLATEARALVEHAEDAASNEKVCITVVLVYVIKF